MEYYCKACGRKINKNKELCSKHQSQFNKWGFVLDTNPRTEYDLNEIFIKDTYAEIVLYDDFENEITERIVIDVEDVERVKNIRWNKKQSCIVGNSLNGEILLTNYLLNSPKKIIFNNGNWLDCRKENLSIVDKEYKIKKVDKRKKGKIDIISYGTSTTEVTGSCWGIEYDKEDGTRGLILLENGISQGKTISEDYIANEKMANHIPYNRADFMLFSHIHGDHLLLSPSSIPRGFKGQVIMTKEMKILGQELLLDGSFIHEKNVNLLRKMGKKVEPLFSESDTYLFLSKVKEVEMNKIIELSNEVKIRLVNNSHVLGACQIELYIKKPSNHICKILYTGDLGSSLNSDLQPFLVENKIVTKADLMICESTYGASERNFTKKDCIKERKDLAKVLNKVITENKKCLIPSFSFGRSQSIMCFIYENLKDRDEKFQVVIDSKLTNGINSAYRKVLNDEDRKYWEEVLSWDKFKFITSFKDTLELASKKDDIPRIIISSSGFMEAGHVKIWASKILEDKNGIICFIGYGGKGTLADRIQNGNKEVIIDGLSYKKKCKIKIYRTFSSHIQQDELIDYFKQIHTNKIILHHGSEKAKSELKEKATEELRRIGKTTQIVCCDKNTFEFSL